MTSNTPQHTLTAPRHQGLDSARIDSLILSREAALGNKGKIASRLHRHTEGTEGENPYPFAFTVRRTPEAQEALHKVWSEVAKRKARKEAAARRRAIRYELQELVADARAHRNDFHWLEDRDLEAVTSFEKCGRYVRGATVEITYDESTGQTAFEGMYSCHRVSCPWCAQKSAHELRLDLEAADREAKRLGLTAVFITRTMRHRRGQDLDRLLGDLLEANRWMFSGRWNADFREEWQPVGRCRVVETNWSVRNSWHPHIHEIWYFDRGVGPEELKKLQTAMEGRWIGALGAFGRTAETGIAVKAMLTDGSVALSEYLSKLDEIELPESADYVQELGGLVTKKARADDSFTPMDLAAIAAGADPEGLQRFADAATKGNLKLAVVRAEVLWQEYFYAIEGRHLVEWSKGLRKLLKVEEGAKLIEAEQFAEQQGRKVSVGVIFAEDWQASVGDDLVLQKHICDQDGNVDRIRALLAKRGVVFWQTGYVLRE